MHAALMPRQPAPMLACGAFGYDGASDASQFDWRGVAAGAAAGYVSASLGQGPLKSMDSFSRSLATGMAGGIVSAAVRGGSLNRALPGIVTDVIGSTIGNVIGDALARGSVSGGAGEKQVVGPVSASERQTIMGYFADGPGTGNNAALTYLNNTPWSGMSDTSTPAPIGSDYDAAFGPGSMQVGGPPSFGGDSNSTWADKYKPVLDQYRKTNPLEVDLFSNMLQTIPSYVVGNESTWASVVSGFDTYARQQAIPAVGAGVADFENTTLGLKSLDPSSWFDRLTAPGDARSAANLPGTYVEAVQIIRNGPQVFNQAWYEGGWGSPPRPWPDYAPGWTPAKPEAK